MGKIRKIISFILASALLASIGFGCLNIGVLAEESPTYYTMKQLVDNDQVKLHGRTRMNGDNLVCEWVVTGFEMNVTVPAGGTTFTVYTDCTLNMYADIIVDGDHEHYTRAPANPNARSLSKEIPEGTHNIRVLRDSGPDKTDPDYHYEFEGVSFTGTIEEKPADKKLYIEYVGASGQLGSGALQRLVPGVGGKSGPAYSSGIYSNAYVSADDLDADFSIVAMGGYGLISAASQEVINGEITMLDLYPYIGASPDYVKVQNGEQVEEYDFARKPDLVVSILGSNDGEGRMADWENALREFLDTVAEKYGPDVPVLWGAGYSRTKQLAVLERFQQEYPNLWIYIYGAGGNGGNALATQTRNHSSKAQYINAGHLMANYIRSEKIIPQEEIIEPHVYENEISFYVDGKSGGDGSAASPFTYIKDAEQAVFDAVKTIDGDDDSISAKIYVKNDIDWVPSSPTAETNAAFTGFTSAVKSKNGKAVTVEIIGVDSKGDGTKPGITVADYTKSGSNPWRRLYNNYRFENVQITGTGTANGAFATLYCFCFDLTMDTGAEMFDASTTQKKSHAYLTTLYGAAATTSYSITTAAKAKTETGSNIVINSGSYSTVSAGSIGAVGAYGPKDDIENWKYDAYAGAQRNFNVTVNGGNITTLQAGSNTFVTGAGANINLTVNGGKVKNLKAGPASIAYYSAVQGGNFNITVNGGTVTNYLGLTGGDTGATYTGNYNFTMTAGHIGEAGVTTVFKAAGNNVTANRITNNISGGHIYVEPKKDTVGSMDGIFFGGYHNTTVDVLTNNFSGGEFTVRAIPGVFSPIFLGGEDGCVINKQYNNVTAGVFLLRRLNNNVTAGYTPSTICLGSYRARINELNNTIRFINMNASGYGDGYTNRNCFVGYAEGTRVKKVTNILGYDGQDCGPEVGGGIAYLGGTNGVWIGESVFDATEAPDPTDPANMSDEVVLSNTVNFMECSGVAFSPSYSFSTHFDIGEGEDPGVVAGSVENVIYEMSSTGSVYFGGAEIYGHLKTTINKGFFYDVYGTGGHKNTKVYDGTELIINDFTSYAAIAGKNYGIYPAGNNCEVIAPLTEGRKAVEFTINGGEFPARCTVYGGSNSGTVNTDIETVINGGTFKGSVFGGSKTGTINGNVELKIYGGDFTGSEYGGSNTGTINGNTTLEINAASGSIKGTQIVGGSYNGEMTGNVTNNLKKTNGTAVCNFYGGPFNGTLNGNVYNNVSGGTYQYYFYCGPSGGTVNGNIINNITGGTQNQSLVAGSYKGTVNGDITTTITGTAPITNNLFASSRGNASSSLSVTDNGNCTLNINGGSTYAKINMTPECGTVKGDLTVNAAYTHIIDAITTSTGTVEGESNFNIDLSKGTFISNGKLGKTGSYKVNVKGGTNLFLLANNKTSSPDIDIDSVDTSAGVVGFRSYNNAVSGRVYVKMPADVDGTKIVCDMNPKDTTLTGQIVKSNNGENLRVIGAAAKFDTYAATFTLNAGLDANILVPTAGVAEVMGLGGRATWYYDFSGEQASGFFTAQSPVKTVDGVDYYVATVGVPTGKFGENMSFSCDGGETKTFTVNSLIAAGEAQYAGDENVSKLFTAVKNYGAEAAAVFYDAAQPDLAYENTDALIAKYDTQPTVGVNKYMKSTNLLLLDKVSVQFYVKADDIADITKITFNGAQLGEGEYEITAVTNADLLDRYNYVISIPVGVINMAEPFTVAFFEGENKVDEYTTSIGHYCRPYIQSTSPIGAKYANVSKALLAYLDQVDVCYGG